MRKAFLDALVELAALDERVFLLTADLGWGVLEPFTARFRERFLNVGVAEQNLLGVATGLAQAGFVPFAYSIATFATLRCYEQFRNGAILHGLPVRLVGVGGGFAYSHNGPTHHALEDLAILRPQPGLTVLAPVDPPQTRSAVLATRDWPGPVYLRIGKGGNPVIPGLDARFVLGRPELVRPGCDLLLLACGGIAPEAVRAARMLEERGLSAAVALLGHLPFMASEDLMTLLSGFRFVVTVEEGFVTGGLGSLAAETIAQRGLSCLLRACGVSKTFSFVTGNESYLRSQQGLDAETLSEVAAQLVFSHGRRDPSFNRNLLRREENDARA